MSFNEARTNMIKQQIRTVGVLDEEILELLSQVRREEFVLPQYKQLAFSELEINLPGGQKMLSPQLEAQLLQELHLNHTDKVLEVGTGSGYVTALLAKKANMVYSIECSEENFNFARQNLEKAAIRNIKLTLNNGLNGLASQAPFDKIFIGGGIIEIPQAIKNQLKIGGILVGIVGKIPAMHAVVIKRSSENTYEERFLFETIVPYLEGEELHKFKF